MTLAPPKRILGDVLRVKVDAVPVDSSKTYQFAGVYSFGRGLFFRGELSGSNTTYKCFHRLHDGMFVMSQPKGWEGALARVSKDFDGFFLSPVYPTFVPAPDQLDVRYLEWYFKQRHTWDALERLSKGMGARRNSVYPEMLLSLEIPLPPFTEQRRIVSKIERLAGKLEEAKQIRKQSGIRTDTFFARSLQVSIEKASGIKKPLNDIVEKWTGVAYKSTDFSDVSGVPVIRLKEISTQNPSVFLTNPESYKNVWVLPGDLLLAKTSFSTGTMCLWKGPKSVLNQNAVMMRAKRPLSQRFLFYWLKSKINSLLSEQLADPNYYPYIREKDLFQWKIPIPPENEQNKIVQEIEQKEYKLSGIRALQAKTSVAIDAMLPSILDRAFKGVL